MQHCLEGYAFSLTYAYAFCDSVRFKGMRSDEDVLSTTYVTKCHVYYEIHVY